MPSILSVKETPHKPTQATIFDNEIGKLSVRRILEKKKYTYKIKLIHKLNEDDSDRRLEFCKTLMNNCNKPFFTSRIIFSDESTFWLNDMVNTQNCRYWSSTNKNGAIEKHAILCLLMFELVL